MTVETGSTVLFHYTGTLPDGQVFDTSRERDPIEFQVGSGQIIPGFEAGVLGMHEGETRTFSIEPEEAYGEYDDNLCHKVDKGRFDDPEAVEVGMRFQVPVGEGRFVPGTVVEVDIEEVVLDLNHPLAGKELTFEVECVEIKSE